jgi:hypothetical protein
MSDPAALAALTDTIRNVILTKVSNRKGSSNLV